MSALDYAILRHFVTILLLHAQSKEDASYLAACVTSLSNHTGITITLCCPDYFAANPCRNINADMLPCGDRQMHAHTHTHVFTGHLSACFTFFPMTISDQGAALSLRFPPSSPHVR